MLDIEFIFPFIHMTVANLSSTGTAKKRLISTSSLSDTSTLANRLLLVRDLHDIHQKDSKAHTHISGHLIYKCGGIDRRTIEKFEKVCKLPWFEFLTHLCLIAPHKILVGEGLAHNRSGAMRHALCHTHIHTNTQSPPQRTLPYWPLLFVISTYASDQ
jgi:hypothetical protein